MFYDLKRGADCAVSLEELDQGGVVIGYLSLSELEACFSRLGFSALSVYECKKNREAGRSGLNVMDDYSFGMATIIQSQENGYSLDRLAFYVRKNLFLVVDLQDADGSSRKLFDALRCRSFQEPTLEKVVYAYFDSLIRDDVQVLAEIQERITALEEGLLGETAAQGADMNRKIFAFKKELLRFRSYYDQLIDLGEGLWENGNALFSDANLRYFRMFADKVTRLRDAAGVLLEMTVHLRETYDAALELNLNKTMKIFTVVTTIFLPLTLIVGWYGMNFTHMPELTWRYGYLAVIIASAAIVAGCLWFFKKKKLM